MPVDVRDILTKTWSMKAAALGEIVADVEDIKQSVAMIVLTAKRSVPGLPEFGCGLYDYIDYPINSAGPLIVREIRNAVTRWEQRAGISDLQYQIIEGNLRFNLTMLPAFARRTDPASSIFIGFELEYKTGLIFLIDQYGYRITVNGKQLTLSNG